MLIIQRVTFFLIHLAKYNTKNKCPVLIQPDQQQSKADEYSLLFLIFYKNVCMCIIACTERMEIFSLDWDMSKCRSLPKLVHRLKH